MRTARKARGRTLKGELFGSRTRDRAAFVGEYPDYGATVVRHDFSLEPPGTDDSGCA
ncbi:MAG: hypothetical protein ACLTLQ_05765 [[Clostridium] scindens]